VITVNSAAEDIIIFIIGGSNVTEWSLLGSCEERVSSSSVLVSHMQYYFFRCFCCKKDNRTFLSIHEEHSDEGPALLSTSAKI